MAARPDRTRRRRRKCRADLQPALERLAEEFFKEVLQDRKAATLCGRVVDGAEVWVIRLRIGEGMHRAAKGMKLPVGASVGHFLGEGHDVLRLGHRVVPAVQGDDFRLGLVAVSIARRAENAVEGGNAKVRASLADTRAQGTINAWQVHLDRAAGNPSNIATLDSFDKTTHRGAFYTVSISDSNAGTLGNYEIADVRITHDGTNAYVSTFGRTSSSGSDLATITADIDGNNVRLRGQISTTNTHSVTAVRRLINL